MKQFFIDLIDIWVFPYTDKWQVRQEIFGLCLYILLIILISILIF